MLVLSEESQRTSGRDAREMNLQAGRAVADAIRTTLGPRGMDKMLVSNSGQVVVTNDGVTILDEMDIDHPAADMVVEVADTQEDEVGDGTTTAVVIAGGLLGSVEDLLDQGVHPTTIVQGFARASEHARERLAELAVDVDPDDTETLERIAATAMTGKGAESARDHLASLVVRAAQIAVSEDGTVDRDVIKISTFAGGSIDQSQLIDGVTLDKEPVHANMPERMDDARILIYEGAIEISETETDTAATVRDASEVEALIDRERGELEEEVEKIVDSGANVVLVDGGIDDHAQALLADAGIMAFRRITDDDRRRIAQGTGANRVTDLDEVSADDLGSAGSVEQEKIRIGEARTGITDETVVFDDLGEGQGATLVLRAGTDHVLDEVERAVEDALGVVTAGIEGGEVLPGGGAPQIEAAQSLEEFADGVEGRQQLAVEAFAEALETIPRTLAENAGHDPIDALVELRSRHADGETGAGLNADTGEVEDTYEAGVVEPLEVTSTAVESATEAASLLLRIDDVISAGDLSTGGDDEEEGGGPGAGGPGGGMGGMGGMGGAM